MSGNPLRKLSKAFHVPNGDHHSRRDSEQSPHVSGSSQSPGPHRRSLAQILRLHHDNTSSDGESDTSDFDSDSVSKNQQKRLATKQKKKEAKSRLSLEHRDDSEDRSKLRLEEAAKVETDEMKERYGELPLMMSTTRNTTTRINLATVTEAMVGQEITFRCRLHHIRNMGVKLVFLIFRQQITTIQGVMVEEPNKVGPLMMHWTEHLRTGSIVLVTGTLKKPEIPVKSVSMHTVEIHVSKLKLIVRRAEPGMSTREV
jgi:ergosteryl-3beta-O-L-aspartate synthase